MIYNPKIPANYREICTVYDIVSADGEARKIARPAHISIILGDDGARHYYFMDALMHSLEYEGKNLVSPIRRNKEPPQLHALDSALKPLYRLYDNNSPVGHSGYLHLSRENCALIVHDLQEDFGKSLIGSLIVNDIMIRLFDGNLGKNADLLTNKSALVLGPIKSQIEKLPIIDHNSVYDLLGKQIDEFKGRVSRKDAMANLIRLQYQRVLGALTSYATYVNQEASYLVGQKNLLGIINDMSKPVSDIVKNKEFLEPDYVIRYVIKEYERVMNTMKLANDTGNYDEVDEEFLSTIEEHKTKFLLTLGKTLYRQIFVKGIAENVKLEAKSAFQKGDVKDDSYLSSMIEKNGDCIDVVSSMDHTTLSNDTSIFRKARSVLKEDVELGQALRMLGKDLKQDIDYQRLQVCTDYLLRNLNSKVGNYLAYLREEAKGESRLKSSLAAFELMQQKMVGFTEKVAAMTSIDDIITGKIQGRLPLFEGI